jgi:hypothetical protein
MVFPVSEFREALVHVISGLTVGRKPAAKSFPSFRRAIVRTS